MSSTSVMQKYLKSAQDVWEETKHHRADNGRFTSGTGRGKTKGDDDGQGKNSQTEKDGDSGRKEMSEEQATKIVRRAFEEAKCELKGLKLVEHHLRADVKEADEGSLDAINGYLTKRGLKAQIQDKTSYKIAEDGYDDMQVVDDPMLEVLVDLCRIEMLAKDLHYRAKGKPFYGLHELADLVWQVGRDADDLNEIYYMGEKQEDPPERSFVAAKAAELVGQVMGEDALIQKLTEACSDAANAVEAAKSKGVSGGTASVLDDVSKKSLQAKGLLLRTMAKSVENNAAIDKVIGKGFYFKPDASAQDSGTHEGAIKAAETRKNRYGSAEKSMAGNYYQAFNKSVAGFGGLAPQMRSHIQSHINNPDFQKLPEHVQAHVLSQAAEAARSYHQSGAEGTHQQKFDAAKKWFSNQFNTLARESAKTPNFSHHYAMNTLSEYRPAVPGVTDAQDAGTSEGAKKGWEKRKHGGGVSSQEESPDMFDRALEIKDEISNDDTLLKHMSDRYSAENPDWDGDMNDEGYLSFEDDVIQELASRGGDWRKGLESPHPRGYGDTGGTTPFHHALALANGSRREIAGQKRGLRALAAMGHTVESAKTAVGNPDAVKKANEAYSRHWDATDC